jgi:predicted DsbA family dithiol-disulfide isomerase
MKTPTPITIGVYTDVICPWCYLGKRRLDMALLAAGADPAKVRYLPYELNPDTPREGVDRVEYLRARYGERALANDANIVALGREVGIDYHFDKAARIPNTFNAHRLIRLAGEAGVQVQVVEALHEAHFTDGEDIGDDDVLTKIAVSAGLDAARVRAMLASDEGEAQVRELEQAAVQLGVSGVPFFIFNNRSAVSGAQSVEMFASILQRLGG